MSQLPTEVLYRIVSCFRLPDTSRFNTILDCPPIYNGPVYSHLARICLVCKSFYTLARPLLYETLDLRALFGKRRLLLSTIASKPQLAAEVKNLVTDSWEVQDDGETTAKDENNEQSESDEPDDEQTKTILAHRDRFPGTEELRGKLARGVRLLREDAEIALLVGLCGNLSFFAFQAPHLVRVSLLLDMLPQTATSPGIMQLKELHVHHWDTEGFTPAQKLAPILWLPHLQRFTGYALKWDGGESLSKSSALKSFRLYNTVVNVEAFPVILRSCPNLEELIIEYERTMNEGVYILDYQAIGTALRNHAPCLRKFVYNDDEPESFNDAPGVGPLGDISTLSNLQELTVSGRMLFGEDDENLYDEELTDADSLLEEPLDVRPLTETLPTSLVKLRVIGEYFNDFVDETEWFNDLRNDSKFVNLAHIHEVVMTNGWEKVVAKY